MTDYDMSRSGASRPLASDGSNSTGTRADFDRDDTASFSDIKRQAADDLQSVRDKAVDQAHLAADKAADYANEEKNFAARQLGGLADALEKVGSEMRKGENASVGRYASDLGSSLKSLAADVEHKDMGQIAAMAEDFGRRQPLAFLGAAALAGLAASRFVTASQRRSAREADKASSSQTAGNTATRPSPAAAPPASPTTPTAFGKDRANVQY